jgi:hypothetical protein
MMMEAVSTSETCDYFNETAQHNIPEGCHPHHNVYFIRLVFYLFIWQTTLVSVCYKSCLQMINTVIFVLLNTKSHKFLFLCNINRRLLVSLICGFFVRTKNKIRYNIIMSIM